MSMKSYRCECGAWSVGSVCGFCKLPLEESKPYERQPKSGMGHVTDAYHYMTSKPVENDTIKQKAVIQYKKKHTGRFSGVLNYFGGEDD